MSNLNRLAAKQSQENKKMLRSQHSVEPGKAGQRLYSLGIYMKEDKMRKNLKYQKEIQIQEQKSFTFTPQINRKFFAQEDSMGSSKNQVKREQKLLEIGKKYNKQIEDARNKFIQQEQMECSFQPTVNEKSKQLSLKASKSQSSDYKIHDQLYADAKAREIKKKDILEQAKEETPFKPDLSTTETFKSIQQREGDIADRLIEWKQFKDNQKEIIREEIQNSKFDPKTKQQLFKPQILRGPKDKSFISYDQDISRQEQLYQLHSEKLNKIEQIQKQKEEEIRQMQNNKLSNKKSDIIYEKLKKQKCREIFSLLDGDEDGQISQNKININSLEQESMVKALQPILDEIQNNNVTMDFKEFQKQIDSLFDNLNVDQRLVFLGIQKKKFEPSTEEIETTFQPKINDVVPQNLQPLNERMAGFLQRHNEKVKQQKEEKQSHELDGCTFYPQVKNPTKPVKLMANFMQKQNQKMNQKIKETDINNGKEDENYKQDEENVEDS